MDLLIITQIHPILSTLLWIFGILFGVWLVGKLALTKAPKPFVELETQEPMHVIKEDDTPVGVQIVTTVKRILPEDNTPIEEVKEIDEEPFIGVPV